MRGRKACLKNFAMEEHKSVLIMGFPMNGQILLQAKGLYWATQLELQLRVARLLIRNGIRVEYKAHPERLFPVSNIMRDFGVDVIGGHIEKIDLASRLVVLTYCASSTFPFVLKRAGRIIYINSQHVDWRKSI